jgi:PmbA protein
MKDLAELKDKAHYALTLMQKAGAEQALVTLGMTRQFKLVTKNEAVELLQENSALSLALKIYLKQRFGAFTTSQIAPESLKAFIEKAVAMVRLTDADPAHGLPRPQDTAPLPRQNLQLFDPAIAASQKAASRDLCRRITAGSRAASPAVIHVTASFEEVHHRSVLLSSAGFYGEHESTRLSLGAEAYIQDQGRKQEDYDYRSYRQWAKRDAAEEVGATATGRALQLKGAKPMKTGHYPVVIVNYAADYVVRLLLRALEGSGVYRQMSCLGNKRQQTIARPLLSLSDDPLLAGGLASRAYDEEGMVAKKLPLIEKGVLKNFYYNSYWARKQGTAPTTGSASNLVLVPGKRSGQEMLTSLSHGIYITSFLGGNFNPTSGDFSVGVRGALVERGALSQPIMEMNLAGDLLGLLQRLVEVGNDPYPYSPLRTPALRFDKLTVSGI